MNRHCHPCNGSGIVTVARYSPEAGKKVALLRDCTLCEGSGRRHCCRILGCRNYDPP